MSLLLLSRPAGSPPALGLPEARTNGKPWRLTPCIGRLSSTAAAMPESAFPNFSSNAEAIE